MFLDTHQVQFSQVRAVVMKVAFSDIDYLQNPLFGQLHQSISAKYTNYYTFFLLYLEAWSKGDKRAGAKKYSFVCLKA